MTKIVMMLISPAPIHCQQTIQQPNFKPTQPNFKPPQSNFKPTQPNSGPERTINLEHEKTFQ